MNITDMLLYGFGAVGVLVFYLWGKRRPAGEQERSNV